MKRVVIVHGWGGYPEECWFPYTKQELEKAGFEVHVSAMPNADNPLLNEWLEKLQHVIGQPDDQLWLIGHSLGCPTILRYLQSLTQEQIIAGIVLVAAFTEDLGINEIRNFIDKPFDFNEIKKHISKAVLINSDNDDYIDLRMGHQLQKDLNAELIIKLNHGHFSRDEVLELPDVVNVII